MSTDTCHTDQLARTLAQKYDCLRQLQALGAQQLGCIAAGDMEQLISLLGGKQRMIERLQEIERALDPFRQDAHQQRQWRSAEVRMACERLAADCQRLLHEVLLQEQQSEQQMVLRRDETGRQIHALNAQVQARDAYGQRDAPWLGQLDLTTQ